MKYAKKFVSMGSLLLAIMIVFSFSSCSGGNEIVEIKIVDMFSNEEITFSVPKIFIKPQRSDPATHFASVNPKVDFDTFNGGLTGMYAYISTRISDDGRVLVDRASGTTYSLIIK